MEPTNKWWSTARFPTVVRNKIINWNVLNYRKDDWCKEFNGEILRFRQGNKTYRENPFWEQLCSEKYITLEEFFEFSKQEQDNWLYFDYKYMKDVLPENSKLFKEINWIDLGLHNLSGKDSTIWIGNKGAHTPCHMDTYGCNFVVQLYGRKLWILIPPEQSEVLTAVRVPYEESSIYSSYNFFTPNNNLLRISKAYKVVLSPGDVLFVPRHWWHYVENLEVAISINVWVPLEIDHESRLEESLVRHYISNICQSLRVEEAKQLLNPNEYKLLLEPCTYEIIEVCVENCLKFRKNNSIEKINLNECTNNSANDIFDIEQLDIKSYISHKSKVNNYDPTDIKKIPDSNFKNRVSLAERLINSYCKPTNTGIVKENLLKQFNILN